MHKDPTIWFSTEWEINDETYFILSFHSKNMLQTTKFSLFVCIKVATTAWRDKSWLQLYLDTGHSVCIIILHGERRPLDMQGSFLY